MLPASAPVPYFANAAGRLSLDPGGFVRAYWSPAPRQLADTQALFAHMAQAMREQGWGRMLIDQTDMPPFTPQEQQWVAGYWLPLAVREAGYRFGAVVVARQVLTRLATAYITTSVQGLPLVYRSFETDAEAARWLRTQPA